MIIAVIGTGYVGLTVGTCLANLGNNVICVDIDEKKIEGLKKGIIPIYEPGLSEMVKLNVKEGRLTYTTDTTEAVKRSEIIFIAVGTPSGKDGSVDMSYVKQAAKDIAKGMDSYKVIVDKSTVPVGTADSVKTIIKQNLEKEIDFDMVSNPEFLREGTAIRDFMVPDRIVIGADNGKAKDMMLKLYHDIERTGHPILCTDIKSAEIIKYASNAFLATKISFINEIACLCEKMGGDIKTVAKGMGLDSRIGPRFLQAGVGYGGSCFPKDIKALSKTMKSAGCDARIIDVVEEVNEEQKKSLLPKIKRLLPELEGTRIAVWGLAFKPKTDDMREAPSIVVIDQLKEAGAEVIAFDPVAKDVAKRILKGIEYTDTPLEAATDADALIIVTEWDEFRQLDKVKLKQLMKRPNVIDGRNIYEAEEMAALGFNYISVGREIR
ncbi:MAG: UDP-glucose/GDP-mannose dehydrogenase family protein [Nanoarchaeota archaeon]|nr:UDP-glucose/GDP-mannose dehydrogenase family protein [Nanoarchaeota archaeon]